VFLESVSKLVEEPAQSQDEEVSGRVRDIASKPSSHALPTLPRIDSMKRGRAVFFSWALAGWGLRWLVRKTTHRGGLCDARVFSLDEEPGIPGYKAQL